MTFSILAHVDKLSSAKEKGRYICPVCEGNNLTVDDKTGKYQCWNGCECKDIRNALSPAQKPSSRTNDKVIPSPKNKPMPATSVKPKLKRIDLSFEDNINIDSCERREGNIICWHHGYNLRAVKQVNPKKFIGWEHRNGNEWKKGYGGYTPDVIGLQICLSHRCDTVIGCEGQKDTINALRRGIPAIDFKNPGDKEAFKAHITEAKERGLECIVFLPDNDDPGLKQASERASLARECGIMAIVLDASGVYGNMTKGYDFSDWVNDNGDDYDYMSVIEQQMMAVLEKYDEGMSSNGVKEESKKSSAKGKHAEARDAIADMYKDRVRLNVIIHGTVELDGKRWDSYERAYFDISRHLGLDVPKALAIDAILDIAEANEYNPIAEYLDELKSVHSQIFEMTPDALRARIKVLLSEILGLHEDLAAVMMMRTMISAVARAKNPGEKVDTMCVLYGAQGFLKSTFWRVLAGDDYFGTSLTGVKDDNEMRKLHSAWIHEFAELARIFTKTDQESFKTYLDTQIDMIRPLYKNSVSRAARRCILVASTNRQDILRDSTGNRRFWVVAIHQKVDIHKARQYRSELWALANALYEADEPWWLTDDEQSQSDANNERYKPVDLLADMVRDYCSLSDGWRPALTTLEVWQGIFPNETKTPDRKDLFPIQEALTALGYEAGKPERYQGKPQRVWRRKPDVTASNELHPCYKAVTPTGQGLNPICNSVTPLETFSQNTAQDTDHCSDNFTKKFLEGNRVTKSTSAHTQQALQPCNSPVTAPLQPNPVTLFAVIHDPDYPKHVGK
ncbi:MULTISPECIES: VapE domain-containing protein [Calothrix]|uniref:Virulence-associated protein E-like domain-containing protein n=2 Tax=Calothrix TaxID=1186 RepID=A0ABR8AJL6_9CYAN|nr:MULTISPECIES: VapE domain-containing protein [Calothrix]MBD2199984.1 hypothetical protein [Calothrix parietina FACHB-288]MBD2227262.1 hypothetical protein [Calothrix anomala FACHB-343]